MSKNKTKSVLTALSMAILLVGCNNNDDDPVAAKSLAKPTTPTIKTLTVTPSLGKILKAKVVLKNAATNAPIGEQNTGSTGKVTFTIPSSVSTVIAEVQGGNGAQYFDEATGQMVDLPAGSMLRAATTVVANNSEIGVTALSEAAVKRAETLAGTGSIVPHLNTAKAQIESALGVTDILKAPTLVGSQQELAALGSSAAEQYALRLATLAKVAQQQLGSSETAPALKMAQAIANDLADGDIDGSGNTGTLPYDLATFAAQYQAQALKLIQDFIASASQHGFDAAKLQALLTFVQSNPVNFKLTTPSTPNFVLTGFSPENAVAGQEITITGSGFNLDKTKMKVVFANDNSAEILSVTATTLVVKVPQNVVNGNITVTNTDLNQFASKPYGATFIFQNAPLRANFKQCHRDLPDKLGRYGDSCTSSSVSGELQSLGSNGGIISSVKLPVVNSPTHFCTISFKHGELRITSDLPYTDGSGNFYGGSAKLNGDQEDTVRAKSADIGAEVVHINMKDSLGGINNLYAGGEIWINDGSNITYASAYFGRDGVQCGFDPREN